MEYWAQRGSGRTNPFGWRSRSFLRGSRILSLCRFSERYDPRIQIPAPARLPARRPINPSILAFLAAVGILLVTLRFDSWFVLLFLGGFLLWGLSRGPFVLASRGLRAFMILESSMLLFGACVMFLRWQPLWTVLAPLGITQDGTGFKVAAALMIGGPVITVIGVLLLLRLWQRGRVQVSATQHSNQQPEVANCSPRLSRPFVVPRS